MHQPSVRQSSQQTAKLCKFDNLLDDMKATSDVISATECMCAGMDDLASTPRESLEIARNAIIDLHALLKIMDGATSIQPSASDWGDFSYIIHGLC